NNLLDVKITNGGKHDIDIIPTIYEKLTKQFKSSNRKRVNIIGDKGYTSNKYKKLFAKKKMHYIIPDKKNKKEQVNKYFYFNRNLLKKRYKVENYFGHLKQLARIRFLYDKLVYIYEGFLLLGILLNIKQFN